MKLLFVLAMSPLALVMADAAEQDTVNRCATIIRGREERYCSHLGRSRTSVLLPQLPNLSGAAEDRK